MVKKENKEEWFEDKENLANKEYFNIIWWGIWTFSLIIASKQIEDIGLNWKGGVLGIVSVLMLWYKIRMLEEKVIYWRGKKHEK